MYYYLFMFQKDLLKNNVIEELLRERTTYYVSQKKKRDFWIVLSPSFLDTAEQTRFSDSWYYKNQVSHNKRSTEPTEQFCAALISTNEELIDWIALRLGEFENISQPSSFANLKQLNSNGVRGQKTFYSKLGNEKRNSSLGSFFTSCSEELDPVFYVERYQKAKRFLIPFVE